MLPAIMKRPMGMKTASFLGMLIKIYISNSASSPPITLLVSESIIII